jgi:hypothetical protein
MFVCNKGKGNWLSGPITRHEGTWVTGGIASTLS